MSKKRARVFNMSRVIPEMAKLFTEDELDYLARLLNNPLEPTPITVKGRAKRRLSHICNSALKYRQRESEQ